MSGFAKLTRTDGPPLWIRKDQVAALTVYKGHTVVVTAADDVDYEVKETPEQVLALIADKVPYGSLTNENQCGTIRGQRRNNHASRDRQNKGEVPAADRETPRAVRPVVRDAPPVL